MKDRAIREEARNYFVPYILGNNLSAHKLSMRLYKRFGIVSLICDCRHSFFDIFDPSSRALILTSTESSRLVAEQLLSLAAQSDYTLPLIVCLDQKYSQMINGQRDLLEHSFVISDEESILKSSPISDVLK